jgi:hypothetical protein
MTSPLQVMLLFQLVATHNNIPKDRWTLFLRHYETLRDREIAKGGVRGATIRQFKTQIDRVHFDAGYLLHLRAEDAGSANAFLSVSEFTDIVERQLLADGYDVEAKSLADEIASIATDRLVFLRCQVSDQVAFDVRSLQEFMAAARLTSSPESKIIPRLEAIAGHAHWLHVFKISCSKIFGSTGHEALRDQVIGLLDRLDAGDRSLDERLIKAGARLALHVVADGAAVSVPVFRRKLMARVVRLLSVPDDDLPILLAYALDVAERSTLEPLLVEVLSSGDAVTSRQARRLLAVLAARFGDSQQWLPDLLADHWPSVPAEALYVFNAPAFLPRQAQLTELLKSAQWQSSPLQVSRWVNALEDPESDEPPPKDLIICGGIGRAAESVLLRSDGAATDFYITFFPIASALEPTEASPPTAHPMWLLAHAAHTFSSDPTTVNAAEFLERASTVDVSTIPRELHLPWVLKALLVGIEGVEDLKARRRSVLDGQQGSPADWMDAEKRWLNVGVTEAELFPTAGEGGVPQNIALRGGPPIFSRRLQSEHRSGSHFPSALPVLLDLASRLPGYVWPFEALAHYVARRGAETPSEVGNYLVDLSRSQEDGAAASRWLPAALIRLAKDGANGEIVAKLLEVLPSRLPPPPVLESAELLAALFKADVSRRQLLQPIASALRFWRRPLDLMLSSLPEEAFTRAADDPPPIASSVVYLRSLRGHPLSSEDIDELLGGDPMMIRYTLRNMRLNEPKDAAHPSLAAARAILTRRHPKAMSEAHTVLESHLESRPVVIKSAAIANELGLPLALP